ncbi:MAG: actin-related protein 6-like protein [Benjaminiella poitrasii]|nr:MAG: actin-related protein 6-like protein [Benjaminiella poitrasii]
MPAPTIILDNGAHTMKVGISSEYSTPRLVPNAIARGKKDKRQYIGHELDDCTDASSLYYRLPFEKGLLVHWGLERTIWDHSLFQKIDPKSTRLLITEPCFNPPNLQDSYDQVIFEEYQFGACHRTTAPQLCLYNELSGLFGDKLGSIPDCTLVVDSSYSFTYIVPFLRGQPVLKGIRRLNVGGKLLTNHLKEVVSFRSYDMMEETYIINDVKEQCCYISQDVYRDLDICKKQGIKNSIIQEYVLSDFVHTTKGHVRTAGSASIENQQVLLMNNERFMIPEILMHPSDIGIDQAGIPEAITQSVLACESSIHGLLYANIVLVGGNANIPGYMERIEHDLRLLVPSKFDIRIATPPDPVTFSWEGGNRFVSLSSKSELQKTFVQRKEYLEYGSNICRRKFGTF